MRAYAREDGLFDVESHLVDTKPFDFVRLHAGGTTPAGTPLHDLWIRMTVDDAMVLRGIEAASDSTPFEICKEAEATLSVMVGERIERGWSSRVKERLRGAASCTHLMEMLIPLATTALQGIRGADPDRASQVRSSTGEGKIDSCYAYGRTRDVVRVVWPQRYEGPPRKEMES